VTSILQIIEKETAEGTYNDSMPMWRQEKLFVAQKTEDIIGIS
jgi:hypothetical protein